MEVNLGVCVGMRLTLSLISLAFLAACSSAGGVRSEMETAGMSRQFAQPFSTVLAAARDVVPAAGFRIEAEYMSDDDAWCIMAKRSSSTSGAPATGFRIEEVYKTGDGTWILVGNKRSASRSRGELLRMMVRRWDDSLTMVRIYTERRTADDVATRDDHTDEIFDALAVALTE